MTGKTKIIKEISPHFERYIFDWEHKYYVAVGGYGSGKSYNTALKIILKLLSEKRTALVVRNVFDTIRDSCYSLLCEIISGMGLEDKVKITSSPMQMRFKNGSKIIFKGMDNPAKLKSINDVSIIWMEEAPELPYNAFKELIGRLRHPHLRLHFLLTLNPVDKYSWVYTHFFEDTNKGHVILSDEALYTNRIMCLGETYYHHSVADDNYFLPPSYTETLDEMQGYDPDLYRVARLGRFGFNGIKVLPQFMVSPHAGVMEAVTHCAMRRIGMDFGFVESYNAVVRMAVDEAKRILYIYWEYYKRGMTDDKTAFELDEFRRSKELIRADSAEPKTIRYFNQQGFRMVGVSKPPGSRLMNTKKVKRFKKIICSDMCPNTIRELQGLTYAKDRNGGLIEDEFNIDPHTFSAMWYGLDGYEVADLKDKKNYSGKGARG